IEASEKWEIISNCPNYKISSFGRVKNISQGIFMSQQTHDQYCVVQLRNKDGRNPYRVHRLIAIAFIPNPDNYELVDHINGDKSDNNLSNLQWCSSSQNTKNWHNSRTKYNKIIQYDMQGVEKKTWNSANEAATELGLIAKLIRQCCNPNNNVGSYHGSIWKYHDPDKQKPDEAIDYSEYTCLDVIKDLDFSHLFIKNDGTKIVNSKTGKETKPYVSGNGYLCIKLLSIKNEYQHLEVHKIINQVLLGGNYEKTVDHIDRNRKNNTLSNLREGTQKENIVAAVGK